jgi:zinc transporter ZupT
MAIWLGIMLDGIPESIVIGSSLLLHPTMSLSLLAGLFISNFPEALSSSVGMRGQRMSNQKILMMWSSIMIVAGIGAFFGNVLFENVSPLIFALVDGMAAGAMLTMIAETMLPEAFHIGGSVTGLSALAGFLATLLFKVIGG